MLAEAKAALEQGDAGTAAGMYSRILELDSGNATALVGLARTAIALGQPDQARQMLDQLPEEMAKDADVVAARAALALIDDLGETGDPDALQAQRRGRSRRSAGAIRPGLRPLRPRPGRRRRFEALIESIRRDREWEGARARKLLLKIFDALVPGPPADPEGPARPVLGAVFLGRSEGGRPMPNADILPSGSPSADGSGNAKIVYFLYLGAVVFGVLAIAGVIIAYVSRKNAAAWAADHYRFQIRTFWIGLLYGAIGAATSFILVGWLVLLAALIWWIVRSVKGLQYLGQSEPYPKVTKLVVVRPCRCPP